MKHNAPRSDSYGASPIGMPTVTVAGNPNYISLGASVTNCLNESGRRHNGAGGGGVGRSYDNISITVTTASGSGSVSSSAVVKSSQSSLMGSEDDDDVDDVDDVVVDDI